MSQYKSRRTQMLAIARRVEYGRESLREAMKSVAMCAASEERSRTLEIIGLMSPPGKYSEQDFVNAICDKSVLQVLGYSK